MLGRGTELAKEKIKNIQEKLDFLNLVQKELLRSADLSDRDGEKEFPVPEKTCLILPYTGTQNCVNFYSMVNQLFTIAKQRKLKPGYELGLILFCRQNERSQYIFMDVETNNKEVGPSQDLITLPAASYRFLQTPESNIQKAPDLFPDLFEKGYDKIVVELEAFTEISDISAPKYELRCLLPSNDGL